ncbi:MAG: nucleotidyltransferase family protein [Acetatifactor sp.]|nr:nucleotidyltransferase family protein [Acetatifactor sp.]
MSTGLSKEQLLLCGLLGQALTGKHFRKLAELSRKADMGKVIQTAERHKVLSLLYGELCEKWEEDPLDPTDIKKIGNISRVAAKQSYRLLFLTRYLVELLTEAGIPVLVLKGCGVAELYPVPEMRKSGDVDLLIPGDRLEEVRELLAQKRFMAKKEQHANHHLVCRSPDGIDVELHTMLAEPFSDEDIDLGMRRVIPLYFTQKEDRECMGISLPLPSESHQALQLLFHMLQHFLRAGFGLKLLCDWVVFWNRDSAQKVVPEFMRLAEECHVREFAEAVTIVCKDFLGLRRDLPMGNRSDRELAEDFLRDVFAAEEFGGADKDRMVIVQKNSLGAYFKEFHYQMKMNHPKASPYVVLWPALWVVTFAVFLHNNRKFHRGRMKDILRSAGDRSRLLQRVGQDRSGGRRIRQR